jgi:3-isopropylmalate/(R)-2-methylmalate dehydratase small subunit
MPSLRQVSGPAAPMLKANITTDSIAPLYRPSRVGQPRPGGGMSQEEMAQQFFATARWDKQDRPLQDFILNRPPYTEARFILSGANFACGSSRETAVTFLHAFGIRCVVAPSFGQIFYDNCFRNGVLPLIQPMEMVERLAEQSGNGAPFALDVEAGTLTIPDGTVIRFELPTFRRDALITGADEVTVTLQHEAAIAAWQAKARQARPWAYPSTR